MRKRIELSRLQAKLARNVLSYLKAENFAKGHHLVESVLADRLDVSRSPVRAVLGFLAEHGFVETRPNQGFFLAMDPAKIDSNAIDLPSNEEDELYAAIVRDRVQEGLPPEFSESELMRRYDAGRGVVTRVLHRLAEDGVAHRQPGYGWSFLPALNSQATIDESYRFRLMIEPAALLEKEFTFNAGKAAASRKRHLALLALKPEKVPLKEMFETNAEFHEMLAGFSNNRFVSESIRNHNRLRRVLEYSTYGDRARIAESVTEHLAILDALERGDNKWAAMLLTRHLEVAEDVLIHDLGQAAAQKSVRKR